MKDYINELIEEGYISIEDIEIVDKKQNTDFKN